MIDDAIVVLENVVLHRDAGESRFQAIESALREITVPLIGLTITPIVVFLPLISTTGVFGSFFRALAITMSVALASSLLLAVTWTPTLSQYFVRRNNTTPAQRKRRKECRLLLHCWLLKKNIFPDFSAGLSIFIRV